jgi:hypothetical protein
MKAKPTITSSATTTSSTSSTSLSTSSNHRHQQQQQQRRVVVSGKERAAAENDVTTLPFLAPLPPPLLNLTAIPNHAWVNPRCYSTSIKIPAAWEQLYHKENTSASAVDQLMGEALYHVAKQPTVIDISG